MARGQEHANTGLAGLAGINPILPLLGSIASLCVGTSFAKSLFSVAGSAGVTALRISIAALILIVLQRPWRWRLSRAGWITVVRYGVILGVMNLSFYQALRTLPLGIAIAIEFLGPLGVAIFYSARRMDFLWVALAGVGVGVLVLPGSGGHSVDPVGVLFVLVAAMCWALYIVFGKRASDVVPGGQIVCLGLCIAAVIALPFGIAEAGRTLLRPDVLLGGAGVALLSSVIPYSLEIFALKRLPSHVFGVLLSLEPAIGALAGFLILGERLLVLQWLAIGAVMVASGGSALTQERPAGGEPTP